MTETISVPLGYWTGTVTHDGQIDHYTVDFAEDGKLVMNTPVSSGQGTWTSTGPDTFDFEVREVFDKAAKMPASYIDIVISATLSGEEYSGSGSASIHAEDGSMIYKTAAETSAQVAPAPVSAVAEPESPLEKAYTFVAPAIDPATAELHYTIVSRLFEEGLNQGDLRVADELMTADFHNHGSHDDSMSGPESFKFTINKQRSAFTGVRYEILDFASMGDRAAIRWVMRGKHTGPFLGVPPTGLEVEHNAMIFFRFEGDKLAERWGVIDNFTLVMKLRAHLAKTTGTEAGQPQ
jgi:predicted ester cyclase